MLLNACYFRRIHAWKTTVSCAKDLGRLSRFFLGIRSRQSASNVSFALAHENYAGREGEHEGKNSPVLVVHGMLGSKKNWHSFCKNYSKQTGIQVCRSVLDGEPWISHSVVWVLGKMWRV